ncbi:hypothetical protein VC83_01811 [Pseudogymnoascus destructans]|uniref:Uncharacterized protein n=2 Tax=Pseudogymnoascus destructans TaxID=655981 RepID=L8GC81_PSED2|nr:uncharacterized protein VC83_01811 [Pseudogymnoascus destructans]ELR10474.1 hypothetical protein GMDG_04755 [Pseudogymnoascus destructans 20631-21]OAF61392.1 hypothetical protein VC83_01811 [Pseudogymnoascus destructans]
MVRKRKESTEKSTNENTKSVQNRRNNMTEQELKVDNAKRADTAATAYAIKKIRETQAFKDLSPVEQQEKVQSKKDEDGNHASIVQQHLGIGEGGGAYAVWDDNNHAWETEDEDDEVAQEAMWRADELANGIGIKEIEKRVEQLAFTIWRRKWSTAYKSTLKLMNKVNTDLDFLKNLPPAIDEQTGIYYEKIPPHLYFTKLQLAVWRNFASWNFEDGQVSLPGPADWYPDGYDTTQHGFQLDEDATGAFKAWEMLREKDEPVDFKWVLPSDEKLAMLPPTKESDELLAKFYNM